MAFDFDTQLDLIGIHSQKYDNIRSAYGLDPADTIAMWVADMDFPAAPAVREAIQAEAERGYMGYFGNAAPVTEAVVGWLADKHGWQVNPRHIRFTRGVIEGVAFALHALTEPGDGIVVFSPVYHAFYSKIRALGRDVVESPLVEVDGRFEMDLDALEASLTGAEKMVILCSPHNPGGRLWSADEIRALTDLCARRGLWLVSDEIHMDLTFPGQRHVPTLVAAPEAAERTIVLTAASKGFNLAGGETGFAVIPDDTLRAKIDKTQKAIGGTPNRFGMLMTKAAFTDCADWSEAVRAYIAENFAMWRDRVGALPGISVTDMSATYLAWTDFRDTGLSEDEITARVQGEARIAASPGTQFGAGGDLHRRFNLALPRPLLTEAIDRMERAFADLQ